MGLERGSCGVQEETQKGPLMRLWEEDAKNLSQKLKLGLEVVAAENRGSWLISKPGKKLGSSMEDYPI